MKLFLYEVTLAQVICYTNGNWLIKASVYRYVIIYLSIFTYIQEEFIIDLIFILKVLMAETDSLGTILQIGDK